MRPLILVTGGAGFIGSNIVAHFAAAGARVVVCDRLRDKDSGKWRNLAKHPVDDIVHPDEVLVWVDEHGADLQAVVHMGAISATTASDVDAIIQTNFRLSKSLWQHCAVHGVPFVYASSAATYGNGDLGYDDRQDLGHLRQLRPLNPYGYSKALFDIWVAQAVADGAVTPPQWAGLKFFNVYGPNEYHKDGMRSVAAQLFERIRDGQPVRLFRSHHPDYDDGGQMRDFVYVADCVAVVDWLLATPSVSGLFNVGSGRARTFLDLAHAVFAALDQEPKVEFIDTPPEIRAHYQYFTEAKLDKLRTAGFKTPMTSLEDGVRDYVQTHLSQPDRYR